MKQFQFSLRALMVVVCVVSLVMGAWRLDKYFGAMVVLMLCLCALCGATVASLSGTETTRRFWLPFAVFGWGYYWTSLGLLAGSLPGSALAKYLATSTYSSGPEPDYGSLRTAFEPLFSLVFAFLGSLACNYFRSWYGRSTKPQNNADHTE